MSNTTQKNADKIRTRLLVAGYTARPTVAGIIVTGQDITGIKRIANATAACTVGAISGGNTLAKGGEMKGAVKLNRRRKNGAVACSCCGWQGYERDLTADCYGYEHCPNCSQGDTHSIYDDETRGEK